MAYIGQEPGLGEAERFIFTATAVTDTVTADNDGVTIGYTVGQVSVYLNGVKQAVGIDVGVGGMNGSTVVFASNYAIGDVIEVIALSTFSPADSIPSTGGTYTGQVTLPSPVINTGVSGSAVLDSDTMSGVSATKLSSSESIKAYVDNQVGIQDLDVAADSGTAAVDLDTQSFTLTGGTGIGTTATGQAVTFAIDATVATLAGVQTFSGRKTLTNPIFTTPTLGTPVSGNISACTSTSMVMVTPLLGTPTSGTLTHCTFPTANINTDVDISNANLLTKLAALESSGGAGDENITIGTDSGDTIIITGNLQVSGTTTTVNSTTVNLNDHNIVLDSGNVTSAVVDAAGITLEGGSGDDVTWQWLASGTKMELKKGSSYANMKVGTITGALTGNASGTAATVTSGTQSAITTATNLVTTGALTTGSIASGFGTINNGSNTITTTGAISGGTSTISSSGEVKALFENTSTSASQFAYIDIESNATSSAQAVIRFKTPQGTSHLRSLGTATEVTFKDGNVSIGTGGDLETSTTGKVKQKGAFMQSSTHQALTLGG